MENFYPNMRQIRAPLHCAGLRRKEGAFSSATRRLFLSAQARLGNATGLGSFARVAGLEYSRI